MATRSERLKPGALATEWTRITDEANAADAAALAALEDQVSAWVLDPVRRWWSSMTAWHAPDAAEWLAGDARRAPAAWVQEILAGAFSPKHSLVRALTLDGSKATATTAATVPRRGRAVESAPARADAGST